MITTKPLVTIYKRLETDDEFRARVAPILKERGRLTSLDMIGTLSGVSLDDYIWSKIMVQRKIVEVVP